jgi:hypothetical protein
MSSSGSQPGIESKLIDVDRVPFTKLHELDGETLRDAVRHVVERTSLVRVVRRSGQSGGGERID